MLRLLAILPLVLAEAACEDIFEVDNPTNIVDSDLNDAQYTNALANSAEGALSLAYGNTVIYADMVADGIMHVSNRRGNVQLDQGDVTIFNNRVEGVYNELSQARWTSTEVRSRLGELLEDPQADLRMARVSYWDAVCRITLADFFQEIPLDGGAPNEPTVLYEQALDLLQDAAAIANAVGDSNYEAAAHATMARTYRSLYFEGGASDPGLMAQAGDAAATALDIQPDFRLDLVYAPPGTQNALADGLRADGYYDVMEDTWANTVDPVSGESEPRIPHGESIGLSGSGDPVYQQMKYANLNDPIPVSRWQEASLILAEARLVAGNTDGAVAALNDVREGADLPTFSSADPREILDQLVYERAVEFWLEGRRWQDMRYYDILPPRWSDNSKSQGIDRRWPVSLQEKGSNPNY